MRLTETIAPALALAVLVALTIAGFSIFLGDGDGAGIAETSAPAPAPDRIDYALEQIDAEGVDGSGRRYQLQAARLDHHRDDGSLHLAAPRYTLHYANARRHHSRADRGWISADGAVLHLYGNVRVTEEADDDARR